MSAAGTAFDYRLAADVDRKAGDWRWRRQRAGTSVLLLALMLALAGWAIDNAR